MIVGIRNRPKSDVLVLTRVNTHSYLEPISFNQQGKPKPDEDHYLKGNCCQKTITALNCMKMKGFTYFNKQEIMEEIRLRRHELAELLKYFGVRIMTLQNNFKNIKEIN